MEGLFGDAQTTITSLSAGIVGAATERVADMIVGKVNMTGTGVGTMGMNFVLRAVLAAGGYSLVSGQFPGSSQNIFFSILFFAAQPKLMGAAVGVSQRIVGSAAGAIGGDNTYMPKTSVYAQPQKAPCGKSCGSMNY